MTPGTRTSVSPSDSEVIARSAEQPAAFTDIFERHFQSIFAYLVRRVGVREEAEDLASQTFVIAFEKRATFLPHPAGALPWLYGIATNLVSVHRRREVRGLRALAKHSSVAAHRGSQEAFRSEDRTSVMADIHDLNHALEDLDSGLKDTLLLFAWADLNYEQISIALDIPIGTVASRISRARHFLLERLDPPSTGDIKNDHLSQRRQV